MKGPVFDNRLLFIASSVYGEVQHVALGPLPLFVQTEVIVPCAAALQALLPVRWL